MGQRTTDRFGKTTPLWNLGKANTDQFQGILHRKGCGRDRRKHHLAIDAVGPVGPAGVAKRKLCRQFRVAGAGIAPTVRPDLRADPFTIGIAMGTGVLGRDPIRPRYSG